ncbi:uncharacterized protein LOC142349278 isoform X2 [Convolutriloba macropyga]|uniref:uncharacterized protein LOC142349278 isoform X2 n=1 Tax=Convolutriloba macropyga TaxID=536237 RepID=UPI003F526CD5
MSSIVERQRLMREKWKQQTIIQQNNNSITRSKSSNDVLAAIEQEINEAQERERRHKKSIENRSPFVPTIQASLSTKSSSFGAPNPVIVEPPINYRDPSSPSDSVFTSPSSTGEFASTIGSENRESQDCGDDSAFGSLVDPEDTFDTASVDEEAFAHENLPIIAKRSFWERKHREALEAERKRREEESHLELLRQRKDSSRWGADQVKRASSLSCLIASDFTDGDLPTCEFVEAEREKPLQNSRKITVDNMKSHWNGRFSRNSSTSHLNQCEDDIISADQKFKNDLERSLQRRKETYKELIDKSSNLNNNRSRKTNKQTNNNKNGMRGQQGQLEQESQQYQKAKTDFEKTFEGAKTHDESAANFSIRKGKFT